jgi:hypothetical protein
LDLEPWTLENETPFDVMQEGYLIAKYNNELMSNSNVRSLIKAVVQDPTTETQDLEATKMVILKMVDVDRSLLGDARRMIIGWLNECYFSNLTNKFWFEMHTRMDKILTVSILLESLNLRSFGVFQPEKSDIPSAITYLYHNLITYRQTHLEQDRKNYMSLVDSKWMCEFTDLYCT